MRIVWTIVALVLPLVCGSCVTKRVVDDGNEANRLIEEESSAGLSR